MSTLIVFNQTPQQRLYLSGLAVLPASGVLSASVTQIYPLSRDPNLIKDCEAQNVFVSDGANTYQSQDAIDYLNEVATSIGGAVVGFVGASPPNFAILVGAVNSGGSVNNIELNAFNELSIQFRNQYQNLTSNSTTTVKSGSGRLHSILINNNTTGGTVTIYDNTAASGTIIATMTLGTPVTGTLGGTSGQPGPLFLGPLGLEFTTGLTVVLTGSTSNNITVCYQ